MRFLIQLAFLTGFFILGFLFAHEPFRKALFEPLRDAVPQATDAIERFHQERARTPQAEATETPQKAPEERRSEPAKSSPPTSKPQRKELAKQSAPARKPAAAPKRAPNEKRPAGKIEKDTRTARTSDHLTDGDRRQLDNLLDDVATR